MVRRPQNRHALQERGDDGVQGRHHPLASEFDPQPFHLDEEAAKNAILGGLAASGWHTAAIAMRLATNCKPFGPHPMFGAGVDDLRWLKPVRPGDCLHLEREVVELVPSKSKPQGVVRVKWTAYNQHGEAVYTSIRLDRAAAAGMRRRPLVMAGLCPGHPRLYLTLKEVRRGSPGQAR